MSTKKQSLFVATILVLLGMITSACTVQTPRVGLNLPSTVFDVNVDMADHSEVHFSVHGQDFWMGLLDHVERVELHDGFIRYYGFRHVQGGARQYGSIDLRLSSENGTLMAEIIALDIPGFELTDPQVIEINAEMKSELSWLGYGPDVKVFFHNVRVTPQAITMRVQVDLDL